MFFRQNSRQRRSLRPQVRAVRLGVQQLEPRLALAGDVNIFVDDGTLTLIGDNAANAVRISQEEGRTIVTPLADAADIPTRLVFGRMVLNTPPGFHGIHTVIVGLRGGNDSFTVARGDQDPPVFQRLTIDMEGGDDRVEIFRTTVFAGMTVRGGDGADSIVVSTLMCPGSLAFDGGAGNDEMAISASQVGTARIDGGEGNERVSISRIEVGASLDIFAGHGANVVLVYGVNLPAGRIAIESGVGQDLLVMSSVSGHSDIRVALGAGDDRVAPGQNDREGIEARSLTLDLSEGNDTAALGPLWVTGNMAFMGHGGADVVHLSESTIGGVLRVDLGNGSNTLWMSTVVCAMGIDILTGLHDDWLDISNTSSLGFLRIRTDHGRDSVALRGVSCDTLDIATGGGNDRLWLDSVVVSGISRIDGGTGQDEVSCPFRAFRAADFIGFERVAVRQRRF